MKDGEEGYLDQLYSTVMGEYITRSHNRYVQQFLGDGFEGICLDVGGGSGRFTIPLHRSGKNVVALDFNRGYLRHLQDKDNSIPAIYADGQLLPIKDESVDAVLAVEFIDYVDSDVFFSECSRVLRLGGLLLFTTNNSLSYKCLLRRLLGKDGPFYSMSFIQRLGQIEKWGFRVVFAEGFNWVPAPQASNSGYIPAMEGVERCLRLGRLRAISPWVFIIARKGDVDEV